MLENLWSLLLDNYEPYKNIDRAKDRARADKKGPHTWKYTAFCLNNKMRSRFLISRSVIGKTGKHLLHRLSAVKQYNKLATR